MMCYYCRGSKVKSWEVLKGQVQHPQTQGELTAAQTPQPAPLSAGERAQEGIEEDVRPRAQLSLATATPET